MNGSLATDLGSPTLGHIDYAKNGYVYGWAFDQRRPEIKLTVEILSDGMVIASGLADQYRIDLDDLNFGDGCHGFKLKLSYELLNGMTHKLRARELTSGIELQGGAIDFGPETHSCSFEVISRKSGLEALAKILQKQSNITVEKRNALFKVYEIGSLAQETGRIDDAIYAWSSMARVLGSNALCQCKLAEIKLEAKDTDQALRLYKSAAELDFSFHWAHLGLATIYETHGNYSQAIDAHNIATHLNPECDIDKTNLTKLKNKQLSVRVDKLISAHKTHEAITIIREALNADPVNATAQKLLDALMPSQQEVPPLQYGFIELNQFEKKLSSFDAFLSNIERNQLGV